MIRLRWAGLIVSNSTSVDCYVESTIISSMSKRNSHDGDWDINAVAQALSDLLRHLPDDRSPAPSINDRASKALRIDITTAINRLHKLNHELDPIKRPKFVFDPSNPNLLGELIGKTLSIQERRPMEPLDRFYGSGVYAIYYRGDFQPYLPIKGKDTPIYVGKADPPTPNAKTPEEQGPKLSGRLAEHVKSIRAATSTLNIADFDCRYLVVQSGWQKSAEDYLINFYRPIWNTATLTGFGKHGDSHTTRSNTRSPWDTLHPGRLWATKKGNKPNPLSTTQISEQVAEHFRRHPPRS